MIERFSCTGDSQTFLTLQTAWLPPSWLWAHSLFLHLFVFWRDSRPVGQSFLIHEVSRSNTTTHHSRQDSSGRVISPSQRPLPDNTQHSQQTDICVAGGIWTHSLRKGAAADLRLRPGGHWDRQSLHLSCLNYLRLRAFLFSKTYQIGPEATLPAYSVSTRVLPR